MQVTGDFNRRDGTDGHSHSQVDVRGGEGERLEMAYRGHSFEEFCCKGKKKNEVAASWGNGG